MWHHHDFKNVKFVGGYKRTPKGHFRFVLDSTHSKPVIFTSWQKAKKNGWKKK